MEKSKKTHFDHAMEHAIKKARCLVANLKCILLCMIRQFGWTGIHHIGRQTAGGLDQQTIKYRNQPVSS